MIEKDNIVQELNVKLKTIEGFRSGDIIDKEELKNIFVKIATEDKDVSIFMNSFVFAFMDMIDMQPYKAVIMLLKILDKYGYFNRDISSIMDKKLKLTRKEDGKAVMSRFSFDFNQKQKSYIDKLIQWFGNGAK